MNADRAIQAATTAAVVLVAVIAAYASYGHMRAVAEAHGERGLSAVLLPLSVDGLIVAASMTLLADSRARRPSGPLPWFLLVLGSFASLAANVMHGEPTVTGRIVAAWPPVALVGAYEMLMRQLRARAARRPATREEPADEPTTTAQVVGPPPTAEIPGPAPALLEYARRIATEYRERHGHPITADALRARLGVSPQIVAQLINRLT